MMINLKEDASSNYGDIINRQNKILGNMLGSEIDFLIKGIDNKTRSVAASRKDAMLKKRQIFYLPDANGVSRVCEGRIVQARVLAVAEKTARVEIFGVEYSISARDLSYDWMGDATDSYHVGDQILVRITLFRTKENKDQKTSIVEMCITGYGIMDNSIRQPVIHIPTMPTTTESLSYLSTKTR